ncbi:MAG: hypothetical protein K2X99_12555, partial [Gemmatimonadaceae bacterium]|nr:hypothetical protein [Gemmatimonadaceae bacterium]
MDDRMLGELDVRGRSWPSEDSPSIRVVASRDLATCVAEVPSSAARPVIGVVLTKSVIAGDTLILDYLVSDANTHSILMYIEGIRNARSFMSALRAAARIKPVILVKVGR